MAPGMPSKGKQPPDTQPYASPIFPFLLPINCASRLVAVPLAGDTDTGQIVTLVLVI